MRLRRRWHRRMRRTLEKIYRLKMQSRRKLAMLAVFGCLCMIFWLAGHQLLTASDGHDSDSHSSYKGCAPIDAVYTWVNGTDPDFLETIRRFDTKYDQTRFDDKNELKYSLRSLEKHANWIRHVYIVTNGQIPSWLDLNYDRVTVVPHEVLAPDPSQLPTFSSASIETFLHRIPKLSKRFLYLNDDIFLGAPLFPDDLYTDSEGVSIYQAWMVPDCATDCPWTYIGDGACDQHCNIDACQFDGGDCNESGAVELHSELHGPAATVMPPPADHTPVHKFPNMGLQKLFKSSSSNFKEIMRHKNVSTLLELRRIVERFNKDKLKSLNPEQDASILVSSNSSTTANSLLHQEEFKSTANIYTRSLIATNMLLNRHYGFKARYTLAHVGFLIDRDIMVAMQQRFQQQVLQTAHQRFRAATDLQYAFAYYSFLMSETQVMSVAEIFDEFDTDGSGTWSDREVRTLLARIYSLPLDWSAMRFFEVIVQNCSASMGHQEKANTIVHSTLVYERYEDSNLPTITRELVCRCSVLAEALLANFGVRPKYRFHISPKRTLHNNFMMITSNLTDVVDELDRIRRNPRKFNCINDNLDPKRGDDNELVRHLLEDFYLSFFPRRSKFELPPEFRNRYVSWSDYQRWRRRKRAVLVVGYGVSLLLVVFLACLLCQHKAKIVRRCVQCL
ncbi:hypothetical protein KR093_008432 [Drosophila rubida]|uniref:N-acetylglucosamine-1-phosphotransferase subunits alpha/beta n=1 Tax=Drosophila rubida TaxID=30044 RepID=A0AAD4PLK4_9MUSC|nr:hypothetical protein KR093_008432 [Drosophila rubida]